MEVVRTVELSDDERLTVSKFLKLAEDISSIVGCSVCDVFEYFLDEAEITENGYNIKALHQLDEIH